MITVEYKQLREDGLPPYILWKGEIYDTPDLCELRDMVLDSIAYTPDEDTVEPDHPDSWLFILGFI
jgi:hypothetical protein